MKSGITILNFSDCFLVNTNSNTPEVVMSVILWMKSGENPPPITFNTAARTDSVISSRSHPACGTNACVTRFPFLEWVLIHF